MAELPDAVLVVIRRGEHLLMIRRAAHLDVSPGYWTPPGGRVEPGETQAQAAVRETAEEVGLEVRAVERLGEMPSADGNWRLHWWRVEWISGEAHAAAPEVDEVRWVTLAELRALQPIFDADLAFLERPPA